jgi:2-polyprenyl-3-methyl-5-hydroxy-6-metoxy-1,4-benzoquinol methylase
MDQPAALAHVAIYHTVEDILRDAWRGRLLDVPAGEGALAKRLLELGFDVACCDLYPQIFKLDGVENRLGNLDGTLPYDDGSFDHIVCVEGLEHIENPANAIREFSRLLRSGGDLIVSVPNIMNVEERLKWLFSGYTSHFKPLSIEARESIANVLAEKKFDGMDEVAYHVNPIGYSEVRYLLEKTGFEVESVSVDKPKKTVGRLCL